MQDTIKKCVLPTWLPLTLRWERAPYYLVIVNAQASYLVFSDTGGKKEGGLHGWMAVEIQNPRMASTEIMGYSTPSSPGRDECLSPLLNLLWPTLVRKWGTSSQPGKGFPLGFGCLGLGRNRVFSLKCLAKVRQYCSKGFLFCWVTPLLVLCLERVGSFCT